MKVAIVGFGYVGKAMRKLFDDVIIYDVTDKEVWASKDAVNECDIVIVCVNTPQLEDVLTPAGYEDDSIIIPPNPFLMGNDDEIFFMYYKDLIDLNFGDTNKGSIELLRIIWKRIGEIKTFLGITKGTRYIGEEREEWRLINELDWYITYPESAPMMYHAILGDPEKEKVILLKFKNFLRDRNRIKGIKSLKYY
ncbi:hypothetical protein LCGC14_2208950 [marine sediment metagenome]|uniref:UDP-glucose/GDP-mannose dehydrogenase N-terminal domain-containing protein n=1 Tax=marine sediment metagenome TaxID=412755 RepID=A0A0F9DEJ9_9ZZZZ